jgi:hypothetical protein
MAKLYEIYEGYCIYRNGDGTFRVEYISGSCLRDNLKTLQDCYNLIDEEWLNNPSA